MKSIILAAGYATRLYPLTENFPKPLLEIGRSTILDRLLDDVDTIPGITGHVVVTNGKFAPIFEKWAEGRRASIRTGSGCVPETSLRDPSHEWAPPSYGAEGGTVSGTQPLPVQVLSDGTFSNETRLGAVRDLVLALETFGIDDDILVLAADNILEFSLKGFVEEFRRKGTSMIMCHHEQEIYKLQRTGVIEVDGDFRVLQMQEKPQVPVSHWAVPPFYIYKREDLPLVRGAIAGCCGTDAPGNLAHYMVEHTAVHAWPMPAGRFDIGSLDTYEQAKLRYK
jgi:glucose-1-phosphate thymidylyltransferase